MIDDHLTIRGKSRLENHTLLAPMLADEVKKFQLVSIQESYDQVLDLEKSSFTSVLLPAPLAPKIKKLLDNSVLDSLLNMPDTIP